MALAVNPSPHGIDLAKESKDTDSLGEYPKPQISSSSSFTTVTAKKSDTSSDDEVRMKKTKQTLADKCLF